MVTRKVMMLLASGIFTLTMSSTSSISGMPTSLMEWRDRDRERRRIEREREREREIEREKERERERERLRERN